MNDWKFKLLYDGACPLCLREVQMLQRWNRDGALAFEDIASPEMDPAKYGTTREELLGVIHGVFPDGRVVRKVEVDDFTGVERVSVPQPAQSRSFRPTR